MKIESSSVPPDPALTTIEWEAVRSNNDFGHRLASLSIGSQVHTASHDDSGRLLSLVDQSTFSGQDF